MNGSVLLLLPMILPFIFGLIIGFQKEEKQRNILVFIAMAVEAALVWYLCSGEMQTFVLWRISDRLALVYKTDGLARFFACLISTIWLIAAVFSMEYMKHEHKPARMPQRQTTACRRISCCPRGQAFLSRPRPRSSSISTRAVPSMNRTRTSASIRPA